MTFERLLFVFWVSKSHLMYHKQKHCLWRLCRRKTSAWQKIPRQHGGIFETFSPSMFPFPLPVVNHIYHMSCVYNSSLSCSSIGDETYLCKLTWLMRTELKSHKAFIFREHHHYFIFPGKWAAQFCLITSRALMHYKQRSAFATFRVVVRSWYKPYQHS